MKAWLVRKKDDWAAEVVFAETRGKARAKAQYTDACEDVDFIDIEVHRQPEVDKYYKEGKWGLDWDDPQDRIVLVKECGFWCEVDLEDCEICSAKEYCDRYKDEKRGEADV